MRGKARKRARLQRAIPVWETLIAGYMDQLKGAEDKEAKLLEKKLGKAKVCLTNTKHHLGGLG